MKTRSSVYSEDFEGWRKTLEMFPRVDVCQTPEYHAAYSTRTPGSTPVLWCHEQDHYSFCYPFLLTPVGLGTDYKDISSIYGYSGPLCNTRDLDFLKAAWFAFDSWANEMKIIAEFTRFSLYADNRNFAHPNTAVELNRLSAVSHLPDTEEKLLDALGKKTRNMIRKAQNSGFEARDLDPAKGVPQFRKLYEETMSRNEAPEFFLYDDEYYNRLLSLPPGELRLFGVFHEGGMVAASMAIVYKESALYHLGASRSEFSAQGAGNLAMFAMSKGLMESGVKFLTVGGGRTTAEDDPLFRFKKSNATAVENYYIGKRITDLTRYEEVQKIWQKKNGTTTDASKLIFYR